MRPFHCLKCNRKNARYATKIAVLSHLKKCGLKMERIFQCKFCEYFSKHWTGLTNHSKRYHGVKLGGRPRKPRTKITKCNLCPYTTRYGNMKRHLWAMHKVDNKATIAEDIK